MSHACRKVSAIRCVLPAGSLRPVGRARRRVDADDAVLADAELAQLLADRARLSAPASGTACGPRRCPSPSRRRSAARPARPASRRRSPCARDLVGEPLQIVVASNRCSCADRTGTDRRRRIDAVDARRRPSGRASCRDRSAARSRAPLPTRPGHIALCSAGFVCVVMSQSFLPRVRFGRRDCPGRSVSG